MAKSNKPGKDSRLSQAASGAGVLPEGVNMSSYTITRGGDGPHADEYPDQYKRLVNAFNNGMDSVNKNSTPVGQLNTAPVKSPGPWDPQGKAYQEGGPGQPFLRGAGSARGKEGK